MPWVIYIISWQGLEDKNTASVGKGAIFEHEESAWIDDEKRVEDEEGDRSWRSQHKSNNKDNPTLDIIGHNPKIANKPNPKIPNNDRRQ